MTKSEVINYMDKAIDFDGACGFICIALSREDIATKYPNLIERFDKLTEEQRERVLSNIANLAENLITEYDLTPTLNTIEDDAECFIERFE